MEEFVGEHVADSMVIITAIGISNRPGSQLPFNHELITVLDVHIKSLRLGTRAVSCVEAGMPAGSRNNMARSTHQWLAHVDVVSFRPIIEVMGLYLGKM